MKMDDCLSDEYKPFFAKKLTILPKLLLLAVKDAYLRTKSPSGESNGMDVGKNGKFSSAIMSLSTDAVPDDDAFSDITSDDSDGLVIDLDPPSSYHRRPSVNCFLVKPQEEPPPRVVVSAPRQSSAISGKHRHGERQRTNFEKRNRSRPHERGSQTDRDHFLVGGSWHAGGEREDDDLVLVGGSWHAGGEREDGGGGERRRMRRLYAGERVNSKARRRGAKEGRTKRRKSAYRPWPELEAFCVSDSDMDPPMRCSD